MPQFRIFLPKTFQSMSTRMQRQNPTPNGSLYKHIPLMLQFSVNKTRKIQTVFTPIDHNNSKRSIEGCRTNFEVQTRHLSNWKDGTESDCVESCTTKTINHSICRSINRTRRTWHAAVIQTVGEKYDNTADKSCTAFNTAPATQQSYWSFGKPRPIALQLFDPQMRSPAQSASVSQSPSLTPHGSDGEQHVSVAVSA